MVKWMKRSKIYSIFQEVCIFSNTSKSILLINVGMNLKQKCAFIIEKVEDLEQTV